MSDDKVKKMQPREKMNFRVQTTTDDNKITTIIDLFDGKTVMQRLMHKIVDMQEEQNIKALESLGWVNYKDLKPLLDVFDEQADNKGIWCTHDELGGVEVDEAREYLQGEILRLHVLLEGLRRD